jgi:TldD protein
VHGVTNTALQTVRTRILAPTGLGENELQGVLDRLLSHAIDSADLYFQWSRHESWSLEDGKIKEGGYSVEQGVGVRAITGDKTGFAYSDEIALPALTRAAQAARAIARSGQQGRVLALTQGEGHSLYLPTDPLETLSDQSKVDLLHAVDREARRLDPRITQVMASLAATYDMVLVAASDGTLAADVRPLVRLNVSVIAEHQGRREQGTAGGGGRVGYGYFLRHEQALDYAREAVRQALVNLEAVEAPAGTLTVVLGPGWPGVLLHEAIGHGLEGDFNRKGTSAFSGMVGQRVAAPGVTVVDDGTIENRRGSLTIDDEGTPTQRTVLIEDGILKGYLQDRMNARLSGVAATGNGRRESYAHRPMPRMTNTFMTAGEHDPGAILSSLKRGVYAVNFGGGQVDITSGKFVFQCTEAYLVEDGKVKAPIKGATLIGDGPSALTRVTMVGNDLALDEGVGTCGKGGQSVPVGVGQPTLYITGLTVGGM